jgi:adenosine kinase
MNFSGRFSDHILPDKIHSLNLSFLVDEMKKTRGGTAGNIAYNLGLLDCKPILLSFFGKDGEDYKNFLRNSGVDVSAAPLSKKLYTSQSLVLTDAADNQITSFYAGAMRENKNLRIYEFTNLEEKGNNKKIPNTKYNIQNTIVMISPNTPEAMKSFVDECIQNHVSFMYDPGMQLPRISDVDLKKGIENCKILIGNDYEIELMKKRAGDLRVPILVVTLGEKGAIVFDNRNSVGDDLLVVPHADKPGGLSLRQYVINPAKPKSIIDPTGAGDAFRAGFLAGYIKNFDLKTCGQMGATAAVYTVEKYGTMTHEFTAKEFCARYKENYGVKLML